MEQQLHFYVQRSLFTPAIQTGIEQYLSETWLQWENQPVDPEFVDYIIVRNL